MIYDLASECQNVKTFSGLLLIIGDSCMFSTKFYERFSKISSDFSKIWEISQRFGRFLHISRDFIGFLGILLS